MGQGGRIGFCQIFEDWLAPVEVAASWPRQPPNSQPFEPAQMEWIKNVFDKAITAVASAINTDFQGLHARVEKLDGDSSSKSSEINTGLNATQVDNVVLLGPQLAGITPREQATAAT